ARVSERPRSCYRVHAGSDLAADAGRTYRQRRRAGARGEQNIRSVQRHAASCNNSAAEGGPAVDDEMRVTRILRSLQRGEAEIGAFVRSREKQPDPRREQSVGRLVETSTCAFVEKIDRL